MENALNEDRPHYDRFRDMEATRGPLAAGFAEQILLTCQPFRSKPEHQLRVLDIGCGYGHTSRELARRCLHVTGIEPSHALWEVAQALATESGLENLEFRCQGIYDLDDGPCYDLIVLDNVFEHLPDQQKALEIISSHLKANGAVFILVPNRLWPIEVHYGLPFLSYLPLRIANLYLRITGRGTDYTDASYTPTYWGLNRLLRRQPDIEFSYVLPADISLATAGRSWHYRVGVAAIRRFPWLWAISKAFLLVGRKRL
jgi:SAM-dependent methyltransferase